jgi:cytoskeleton protein RodZ
MPDQGPQQHSELASFGEELRREREIRGISLKEIADATKISRRFLEAIERNDHKTLPAPVFTRGFIREYARYLGLNAEEIVNRYNYAAVGDDRIEKSAHLERLTPPPVQPQESVPPPKKGIPPPYARIDRNVIVLGLIIAALAAVAWWAVQSKRSQQADAASAEMVVPDTVAPPEPKPEPQPATPPPPDDSTLRLVVELTGNSWVDIEADGAEAVSEVLRAGDRRTFEAKDRFKIESIGNAAAVTLTLNEVPLGPLGGAGDVVRNRTLDRAFLENLRKTTTTAGTE